MKKLLSAAIFISLIGCSEQSATDYLSAAKNHIEQQDFDAATIELKNAIRATPELAEARFLLGKMYLKNYQYENAEKEFERALEYKYPASEVVPLLSKTYQKTGADVALLKLSLKQAGLTSKQAAQVKFYKLQALAKLDNKEKALAMVEEIKGLDTRSPFKSLALVYSYFLNDEPEAALVQLESVLASDPTQPDALKLKANNLLQQRKIAEAVDVYRQYYTAYPEDLEMSFIFARMLTDTEQTEEAEPIVDKLLAINSKNPLLNQLKGIARFKAGDNELALMHSEKAIQDDPENTGLRLVAGISAYLLEDYEKSHRHLSFIAAELPPSHQALRLLAASQLKLGLSLEANETISQFDQITSQDASLFSSVGLALMQKGEIVKAKSVLENSPEAGDTAQELARLGMLQLSLNDVSGIINLEQALDKAKTETPDAQSSIEQVLATAYLSTGEFEKAREVADKWKANEALSVKGFMLAGLTHIKEGNIDLAKSEFEQAGELEPNNPQIKMALIELILREKNTVETREKAIQALDELLAEHPNYAQAISTAYLVQKQNNNTQKIVKHIEGVSQENTEDVALTLTLAKIYFAEMRFDDAIETLSVFTEQTQKPQDYWVVLGQSYLRKKDFEKAGEHFEAWQTEQPNNRRAVLGHIMMLEGKGDRKKALELTQKFIDTQGSDPQLLVLHAHLSILNGELEKARASYDALPQEALTLPVVKGLLGQFQINQRNFKDALENLQIAYNAKPNSRNARLIYICYTNLGQKDAAFNFINNHVANLPNDLEILMILAEMQIPKSVDLAINTYKKALAIYDGNGVAHNNIAYLYLQQNKLDDAKTHAERALEIRPDNADVLDTLGQILLLQGDEKTALKYLSSAVSNTGKNEVSEEVYVNYIEALIANNERELVQRRIEDRALSAAALDKVAALKKKYQFD